MAAPHQDNMSNFNTYLDMDDVHTPASDYSAYSQGNMIATHGPFHYSQTAHTDLNGSVWDTTEGTQNFHGDEDFNFANGQITPRGQDQNGVMDEMFSRWITTDHTAASAVAEPMRRESSQGSSGSYQARSIKVSTQKSRPRVISTASQGSHMSHFDMAGNSQMDGYLMPDTDTVSVSSNMFYPTLPMHVGLPADGLPFSPPMLASGMTQQLVDPTQMQLNFNTGNSPISTTCGSLSPVESRISSPGIPEDVSTDAWPVSMPIMTSPRYSNGSSSVVGGSSPSLDHQMGMMTTEDCNGAPLREGAFNMPPSFTRQNSGESESSARNHPLYKNAFPSADGLFHCPWEGESSCNHKPEKLKCNYDKFVDSHLKPYRCKIDSCENARFSSTACLLRHEREAHAMHGHGDKPYLCTYEGCDRANHGNGFPRQWNLRDHMRRVHNDNGSSLNGSSGSSQTGPVSSSNSIKGRKRKSKDTESSSSSRKQAARAAQAAEAAAAARAAEQPLIDDWYHHHKELQAYLQEFDSPEGFDYLQQFGEARDHLEAIGKISKKLYLSKKAGASVKLNRRSYG